MGFSECMGFLLFWLFGSRRSYSAVCLIKSASLELYDWWSNQLLGLFGSALRARRRCIASERTLELEGRVAGRAAEVESGHGGILTAQARSSVETPAFACDDLIKRCSHRASWRLYLFICSSILQRFLIAVEQILRLFLARFASSPVKSPGFERSFPLFPFFDGRPVKRVAVFCCSLCLSFKVAPIPRPLPPVGEGELRLQC